jgi:hypothetical protein
MVDVHRISGHEVQRLMACSAEVFLLPPELQIPLLSETVIPEVHPEPVRVHSLFTHP